MRRLFHCDVDVDLLKTQASHVAVGINWIPSWSKGEEVQGMHVNAIAY